MGWLHQGCLVRCLTCLNSFQRRLSGDFLLLKMHEMVAPGLFGLVLNKFESPPPPKGDTMVQPCCWSLRMHGIVAPGLFGLMLNMFEFPPKETQWCNHFFRVEHVLFDPSCLMKLVFMFVIIQLEGVLHFHWREIKILISCALYFAAVLLLKCFHLCKTKQHFL